MFFTSKKKQTCLEEGFSIYLHLIKERMKENLKEMTNGHLNHSFFLHMSFNHQPTQEIEIIQFIIFLLDFQSSFGFF